MKAFKYIKMQISNQQGMALAVVLMVIVVLSLLGVSLMGLAATNTKLTTIDRSDESAYYIAEAGATYRIGQIKENVKATYENVSDANGFFSIIDDTIQGKTTYDDFEETFGETPHATITVEKVGENENNTQRYKIVSAGTIGKLTRTVSQMFQITYTGKSSNSIELFNKYTVFTNGRIEMHGGSRIYGVAGTNLSTSNSIILDNGARIDGEIYVGPSPESGVINPYQEYNTLTKREDLILPNFPEYPELDYYPDGGNCDVVNHNMTLSNGHSCTLNLDKKKDYAFSSIKIDGNQTLTIKVGDHDHSLVVNNLDAERGHLILDSSGTGKLTMYISNQFSPGDMNNRGDISRLIIYYKGSEAVTLNQGSDIYGSFYGKQANIKFAGGSGFHGPILTGGNRISVDNGNRSFTQMFFAPNAVFEMGGGGRVFGKVITKELSLSNGAHIENADYNESIPFLKKDNSVAKEIPKLISVDPIKEVK